MAERNCKRCFHYNACKEVASHNGYRNINYTESQCKHFIPAADVVPKSEVDDLKRYIILNEDIAIKCKRENGEQNEEYWKGKISAFKQIRAYIDAELKKKYTEEKQ